MAEHRDSVVTDPDRADAVLTRGVNEVIDKDNLRGRMLSGERLRVKLGIDPTSPDIHLGRSVLLLKLRDFQELGHQIVLIVGDATGVIGDTSDKDSERPMLTKEEAKHNSESYFEQAGRVLDIGRVEKHNNSEWLHTLSYEEIGEHANLFSIADFIARDNIRRRLKEGKRVSLRETLYPLMQGYDSVETRADVELGGTDQRFNLLAGRVLQAHFGQEPQNIIMMDLIEGLDGRKMSSSWGNVVSITDAPQDMYGKIMSLDDALMERYFMTLTRIPLSDIEKLKQGHPRDMKMRLADEIVTRFHGKESARKASRSFVDAFSKGGVPENIPEVAVTSGTPLADILLQSGAVSSRSEFRRLVESGAVTCMDSGDKITSPFATVTESVVLRIGKHRFLHVKTA